MVPPGGKGIVTLKVYTRTLSGAFKKYALVYTNDPVMKRFKLTLKGEVIPLVRFEPDSAVNFFGVAGTRFEKTLTICPGQDRPLNIKKVSTDIPRMVGYELSRQDNGCYTLRVINKLKEPGSYSGRLDIHTGYLEKKVYQVRVTSLIAPKVEVFPARLVVGKLSRRKPKESRRVTLSSNMGGSITVKHISYNRKFFEVEVDESASRNGRLRLTVTFDPAALPPGRFREPLVLSFKERNLDPVRVTVVGQVDE